jgi:hypothetical protein
MFLSRFTKGGEMVMAFGTHRVKVRGVDVNGREREMVLSIGGNCRGWSVMEAAKEEFVDALLDEVDDEEEDLDVLATDLEDGIKSVEILDFEPEEVREEVVGFGEGEERGPQV